MSYHTHTPQGFTLFFAMLTASLAIAVGLALYDLTVREIDLAAAGTQSQYAIYAADLGAECALYWDYKYTNASTNNNGGSGSAFSTSTADTLAPGSSANLPCNGQDITLFGPPAVDLARYSGCSASAPWCVIKSAQEATTTFYIAIPSGGTATYCAVVQVTKSITAGILFTTITSRGYNSCVAGATRFERALQLSY